MERALARRLVGAKAQRYVQDFLAQHLPALETPTSAAVWQKRAARVRTQMSFFCRVTTRTC
jgi:S-adenosylmethionine:diacylglycerol 3-amino-3-carboxypropyl transferase